MPAKGSKLSAAFDRFVELLEPVEDVHYVALIEPRRPDIYTFIRTMDHQVMTKAIRAERVIFEEFPDLLIEFHVVFLEGRPVESFVKPTPEFFYARHDSRDTN